MELILTFLLFLIVSQEESEIAMHLSPDDVRLFYKLFSSLLLYVNDELEVVENVGNTDTLMFLDIKLRAKIHNALYDNPELIDGFVKKKSAKFTSDELKIVREWKYFKRGQFYIFRYLKKYTIFLSAESGDSRVYGVHAIQDDFENFSLHLPILVKTTLLQFKDKIIYDGLAASYPIIFGGGIKQRLAESYNEGKAKYGITTSLVEEEEPEQSKEDLLKYYLKNEKNREYYEAEINALIRRDKELFILYHQELGKIHARKYKRKLQELGIESGWFAILDGLIIASGNDKKEIDGIITKLVPDDKKDWLYLFEM